jgi:hypothetical protein
MTNNFIDVRNVAYDFDLTKEFTWDFKDLVEIKKHKRVVHRFYRPTMKTLGAVQNARKFEENRQKGLL